VFGYPTPETAEAAERGEVALGGCVLWGDEPTHRCPACHADLIKRGRRFGVASRIADHDAYPPAE
jgi:hypothetical protein